MLELTSNSSFQICTEENSTYNSTASSPRIGLSAMSDWSEKWGDVGNLGQITSSYKTIHFPTS